MGWAGLGLAAGKEIEQAEGRTYSGASLPAAGTILVAQRADDFIVGVGDGKRRSQRRSWRHLDSNLAPPGEGEKKRGC